MGREGGSGVHFKVERAIHYIYRKRRKDNMLSWTIIFLVIAIIAAIFGFGGIAGSAAWIAQVLFILFLILFVISLFMGRRPPV